MKFFHRAFYALLLAALLACALIFRAQAGESCQGSLCAAYKNLRTGVKPPVRGVVYVRALQHRPDKVVLRLYDHEKRVQRTLSRTFGLNVEFKVGRDWFDAAGRVELCNSTTRSDRGPPSIVRGLQSGEIRLCLLGPAACRAAGLVPLR